MIRRRKLRRRHGLVTIEVIMAIGTVFVLSVLLYWLALSAYIGLYHVISNHTGSPYF